jgi:hypothetical protein
MVDDARDMAALAEELAPTGTLRATINLGNPVLADGTPENPGGKTVAIAREFRPSARRAPRPHLLRRGQEVIRGSHCRRSGPDLPCRRAST